MIKVLTSLEKFNHILKVGLTPLTPPEDITGSEWADKYYYLSEESSGNAGKWSCYPYQIAILDWMTDDRIIQVNIRKSKRVGYTEMLKAAMAYFILVKNRNIATWQPTDTDAKDFVIDSVDPLLRDVPPLGKKLMCKPGTRSKYNTTKKKVFKGAVWDIKGGTSAGNFRRMTKDVASYDECDGFLPDIDGEGNCFKLGDGRLDDAAYPKSIRGSTPGIKQLSLIGPAVDASDVIMYRHVKCPECKELYRLLFDRFDFDNAAFPCPHCGSVITYNKYPYMDMYGEWRDKEGIIRYDEKNKYFTDAEGVRVPTPRKVGVVLWTAYSHLKSWRYFLDEWNEAMEASRRGDITLLKTAVNTLRGETWEERVESRDHSEVSQLMENYDTETKIPEEVLVITIGVDVQGDRAECEIVGYGLDDETWSLDYLVFPGDVITGAVFDDLDRQMMRIFTREDGVKIKPASMFVDAGYQTTTIYKYTRPRRKHKVFAVMGTDQGTVPNKPVWKGEGKSKALLYTSNANEAKRTIFRRLEIIDSGPGRCHFPAFYDTGYFKGLTNAVMYKKTPGGVFKGFGWRKKFENQPDEPLDCRHYANAAFSALGVDMGKLKIKLKNRVR